jgi:uncharacterized protein (DUF302 family)
MSYYFTTIVSMGFDDAIDAVTAGLKQEGFGVLTEIDVQATLKKKLDVDFRKYRILGACNPSFAHKALQCEEHIGTMLPCNVIVQERPDGRIEVSAINPLESMQAVANPALEEIAAEVTQRLQQVIHQMTAS